MMSASSVWFPSEDRGNIGRTGTVYAKIRSIQKRAALTISEKKQLLGLTATKSALQCSSTVSLIYCNESEGLENTRRFPIHLIRTSLDRILDRLNKDELDRIETRQPFVCAPWERNIDTEVAMDELSALITHERLLVQEPSLFYYTDGSGIDGHVGASAVSPFTGAKRRKYVEPLGEYSVYSGELYGILLALELATDERKDHSELSITIFTDNTINPRSKRLLIHEVAQASS